MKFVLRTPNDASARAEEEAQDGPVRDDNGSDKGYAKVPSGFL